MSSLMHVVIVFDASFKPNVNPFLPLTVKGVCREQLEAGDVKLSMGKKKHGLVCLA